MAIVMLRNASLVVNSVDLSDHVAELEITMNADKLEATAMGAEAHAYAVGLRDDGMKVTFRQDYAAGKVDATLSGLVSSSTPFTIVAKPDSGAVSATNPSYTMSSLLFEYQPITGSVGEIQDVEVEFAPAPGSKITRATA